MQQGHICIAILGKIEFSIDTQNTGKNAQVSIDAWNAGKNAQVKL